MKKSGTAHQLIFSQAEESLTVFGLKFKPRSIKSIPSNHYGNDHNHKRHYAAIFNQ
jgi:hypothetical protein